MLPSISTAADLLWVLAKDLQRAEAADLARADATSEGEGFRASHSIKWIGCNSTREKLR